MKKSEKTKIKLGTLRKLKSNLDFNKRLLKRNWRYRYSSKLFKEGYRVAIKTDFASIYSDLFTLRAVEKQIPMPVRINKRIETGSKFPDMFTGGHSKYCPCCGQKLWWPSC